MLNWLTCFRSAAWSVSDVTLQEGTHVGKGGERQCARRGDGGRKQKVGGGVLSSPSVSHDDPICQVALDYAARGWAVFPVNGKHPPPRKNKEKYEWRDRSATDPEAIRRDYAEWCNGHRAGIGLDCGKSGLVVVDLDVHDGKDGPGEWARLTEQHAISDASAWVAQTPSGGLHYYFTDPTGGIIHNSAGKLAEGVDVRANGGYIVAAGSPGYHWLYSEGEPGPVPPALVRLLLQPDPEPERRPTAETSPSANGASRWAEKALADELAALAGTPEGQRNDRLNRAAFNLGQIAAGGELDRRRVEVALESAALGIGLSERETAATIRSGIEAGLQEPRGPKQRDQVAKAPEPTTEPDPETEEAGTGEPIRLTDVGNGRRLVMQHGRNLRYCAHWKSWLVWDGKRWARDETGQVEQYAKETVRAMFDEARAYPDEFEEYRRSLYKHALKSEGKYRIAAMVSMAESERPIVARPDDFDRDPWLLNCANGTLDLRTGKLLPHSRERMITRLTPVAYDPHATAPTWERFLSDILDGNADLAHFMQRAVGYSLTGDTSEQCLFILWGSGANGKSTLIEAIRAAVGEYCHHTPVETLMVRRSQSIPNDIARLKGARLVTATEAEENQRLAESLVKQMTGGDRLTARFLHGEFFEFRPTFKVWLATNHKPVIRGTDRAIWRRIRLVPFTVTIPEEKQDNELGDKLAEELPGILAWAVQGCLAWQREGLGVPDTVADATQSYRDEMDRLGGFLADCCVLTPKAQGGASELYQAYTDWCDANGERAVSGTRFGRQLAARGFDKERKHSGWAYYGLGLATQEGGGRV